MKHKITIDEMRSMSTIELEDFIDNHNRLIEEGIISENETNIDFIGMGEEEIRTKYGFTPIDEFFNELKQSLINKHGLFK